MTDESIETMTIEWPKGQPPSVQYICAIHIILKWFKGSGLTHEQLQKGIDYCMYTHNDQ